MSRGLGDVYKRQGYIWHAMCLKKPGGRFQDQAPVGRGIRAFTPFALAFKPN